MPSKPVKCPKCRKNTVADICWGYPLFDEQMEKELDEGKIVLGGCCVTPEDPKWHCTSCGHEWGGRTRNKSPKKDLPL